MTKTIFCAVFCLFFIHQSSIAQQAMELVHGLEDSINYSYRPYRITSSDTTLLISGLRAHPLIPFVSSYSSNLEVQWTNIYTSPVTFFEGFFPEFIKVNDNLFITCTVANQRLLLFAIDNTGAVQWQRRYWASSPDGVRDVTLLNDHLYLTTWSNISDIELIVKFDLSGNLVWAKTMSFHSEGATSSPVHQIYLYNIKAYDDQSLCIAGKAQLFRNGDWYFYFIMIDEEGEALSPVYSYPVKSGTSSGNILIPLTDGDLLLSNFHELYRLGIDGELKWAKTFTSPAVFGFGVLDMIEEEDKIIAVGSKPNAILQLSLEGEVLQSQLLTNTLQVFASLKQDSSYYVTGESHPAQTNYEGIILSKIPKNKESLCNPLDSSISVTAIDEEYTTRIPIIEEYEMLLDTSAIYLENPIVAQPIALDQRITCDGMISNTKEVNTGKQLLISPNPSTGAVNINLPSSYDFGKVQLSVYNLLGQAVYQRALVPGLNNEMLQLEAHVFPTSGIYILALEKEGQLLGTARIVRK